MRDKSYRIHQEQVKKKKCHNILLERIKNRTPTESQKTSDQMHEEANDKKTIGKMASVHGAGCSCRMCGNPRKYLREKTKSEIISEKKQKDLD